MAQWPPLVESYRDIAKIKDFSNMDANAMEGIFEAAIDDIRGYCRWHIAPVIVDDVITLSAHGAHTLELPTRRILSVSSVVSDGYPLDLTYDVEWDEAGWLRRRYGRFSRRLRGVTVTLTHGLDACPPALLQVLASVAHRGKSGIGGDFARMQLGPLAAEAAQGEGGAPAGMALLSDERRRLSRYRVPVVG